MASNLIPIEHLVQHAVLYLQDNGYSCSSVKRYHKQTSCRSASGKAYDISVMSNAFRLCSWSGRSIPMPLSPPFNGSKSVH